MDNLQITDEIISGWDVCTDSYTIYTYMPFKSSK